MENFGWYNRWYEVNLLDFFLIFVNGVEDVGIVVIVE